MGGTRHGTNPEEIQLELNRQALVSLGKRLAQIETKMAILDYETAELRKYLVSCLDTIRNLQELVEKIIDRELKRGLIF